ncbi:retropepsin-like aspartic protease [Niabella beijingensis]|uniref:retropepsin-like aspartic protease n=1 Tax=Niabella beijingensis TaxID=2872700 RepID=UPI001CBBC748|nr:retropepsin-like aspartic protease [Niabella beijingensis]MBZ4192598.1 retropepsin-like domain-containing protein [Niabella beijingensis]
MKTARHFKKTKATLVFLIMAALQISSAQEQLSLFNETYRLIQQKDFFNARTLFETNKERIPEDYRNFTAAVLYNAFNKPGLSENKIAPLIAAGNRLPDFLMLKLYRVHEDNAMKQYNYSKAKTALETLLHHYSSLLSAEEKDDLQNNLRIWTALEQQPRQKTVIQKTTHLKMKKDKAGLNNLTIGMGTDSLAFIFDTGANMSTVTESTARRLGMNIIPASIDVDAITGAKIKAALAVCKKMTIGNVIVENAVFLVFPDSALAFPQIDYQINGILGFPVIESFREVQLTKDGYFIVPEEETGISYPSNMAIDGLTPMITIDGMHFSFDTGAEQSMLYYPYYQKNRRLIDTTYKTIPVSFAGAGGSKTYKGAEIEGSFDILGKKVTISKLRVLKESINSEQVYGNLGQDLITRFQRLTLNFDRMFIQFD